MRGSRRYGSEALRANALHFASDMAGSVAVLVGLVAAAQGHPRADAIAALFVAVLVLLAAARLIRRNIDVLMDRSPAAAHDAAAAAIAGLVPPVELRRLRIQAAHNFWNIPPRNSLVARIFPLRDRCTDSRGEDRRPELQAACSRSRPARAAEATTNEPAAVSTIAPPGARSNS